MEDRRDTVVSTSGVGPHLVENESLPGETRTNPSPEATRAPYQPEVRTQRDVEGAHTEEESLCIRDVTNFHP